MSSKQLVWFITGCSSGIGRELTLAALARGDKVIATARARSFASLSELKGAGAAILQLDVTAPVSEINQIAGEAVKIYGHVDVVINNAGKHILHTILATQWPLTTLVFNTHRISRGRRIGRGDARKHGGTVQVTNVFGAINVSRAFLPYMRERRTGTIAFIGSMYGWSSGPFLGAYVGTKFALRGMSNALHEEISPFGLRSICFDFGYFHSSIFDNIPHFEPVIEDYREREEEFISSMASMNGNQRGDTVKGVNIIIDVVKGEGVAKGKKPPVGLVVGVDSFDSVKDLCEKTLRDLKEWKGASCSTDFNN